LEERCGESSSRQRQNHCLQGRMRSASTWTPSSTAFQPSWNKQP